MTEHLSGREVFTKALGFFSRNRLVLLFLVLIAAQLLTWRAVVSVEDEVDSVRRAVTRYSCGSSKADACHVIVER
jgi:hypothetical protein